MIVLFFACAVDPALKLDGDPSAGAQIWSSECGLCHGQQGEGTPRGSALIGILDRQSPEDLLDIVRFGVSTMPSYSERLDDADLADLLAWIRSEL